MNEPFDVTPDPGAVEAKLDVVSGASMFVSREYIELVGVMDEDFFVYYEDVEWSLRRGAFRLGYAHDSIVRHIAGSTSGSGGVRPKRSRFNLYLSERNRVLVARKRFSAILAASSPFSRCFRPSNSWFGFIPAEPLALLSPDGGRG